MKEIFLPPTGDAIAQYLTANVEQPAFIVAMNPAKLAPLRESIQGDFEFGVWTQLIDVALSLSMVVSPRVARSGEVEAALELAAAELEHDDPEIKWSRLGGVHAAFRRAIEECHGHFVRSRDLQDPTLPARLQRLGRVWHRAQEMVYEGKQEFLADRIEYLLDQEPLCIGHMGEIVVLPDLEPSPRAELLFEWLHRGGTPITVIRTDWSDHWAGKLFTGGHAEPELALSELRVADGFAEAEWCVRHLNHLLNQGALAYEIAVFLPSANDSGVLLQHAARSHGVPLSYGPRAPITSVSFAKMVIEMLEVLARQSLRGMIRLASWSYWGFSLAQREVIADWVRTELKLGHTSLDQVSAPNDNELTIWFTMLRDWRRAAFAEDRGVRAWARHLDDLLKDDRFLNSVTQTDCESNERDLRTRQALNRTLMECAGIRDREGSRPLPFKDFVTLARRIWEAGDVVLPGRTPGGIPVLTDVNQLVSYDHVVIMGARERSLPGSVAEDPILRDEDRQLLHEKLPDRPALPQMPERVALERRKFALLCAAARKSLTFVWPERLNGTHQVRSFFLDEVERVIGRDWPVRRIPVAQFTPAPADCLSRTDAQISQALADPAVPPVIAPVSEFVNLLRIRPQAGKSLPLRALLQARNCAFRATTQYLLDIEAAEELRPTTRLRNKLDRLAYVSIPAEDLAAHYVAGLQQELTQVSWQMDPWTIQLVENTIEARAYKHAATINQTRERLVYTLTDSPKVDPMSGTVSLRVPGGGSRYEVTHRIAGYAEFYRNNESVPLVFFNGRGLASLPTNDPELALEAHFAITATGKRAGLVAVPTRAGLQLIRVGGAPAPTGTMHKSTTQLFGIQSDEAPDWFQIALREAMEVLLDNRMTHRPGPHCRTCQFEDLCRKGDVPEPEEDNAADA